MVYFRLEFIDESEPDRLLQAADAIALPYREIDASGVAMTAVARGLPVVPSALSGFFELFAEVGGAVLVEPVSAGALARVLRQ